MAKLNDEQTVELYGKAEEVLGQTAQALHAQTMLAYEERKSNDAMRVLSFVFGRNARNLAVAVVRWPHYFMMVDGKEPPALEPDEFQVLFMLASLPLEVGNELAVKWRQYGWRAWRVREAVEDWRAQQKDPKLFRLRAKAVVTSVAYETGSGTTVTLLVPPGRNDPKLAWAGKAVAVSLTEDKGEG